MKIVVIGAGVGGLASALGLIAAGHEVQVFEKADQLRAGGNGLILWPSGTGILRELGIHPENLGMRMDTTELFTPDGHLMGKSEWNDLGEFYGSPTMLVRRGRVVEELANLLPDGVLRFGAECTGAENRSGGDSASAVASFADGSQIEADVVIGADGHGSVLRRLLHGDEPARFTGWAAWHGVTKLDVELTSRPTVQSFMGPDGIVALHPIGDGMLFWAFETPWQDGDKVPRGALGSEPDTGEEGSTSVADKLRAQFGSWAHPIPELLESVRDDDVSLFPFIRHQIPRNWGQGRITLVGDAVHVVSPRTAQGVNQALEDAWVLARVLSDSGNPTAQLRKYCAIRRPKIRALTVTAKMSESHLGMKIFRVIAVFGKQDSDKAKRRNMRMFSNYLSDVYRKGLPSAS